MKKISELSIADLKAAHDFVKTSLDSKEIENNMKEEDVTSERIETSEKMSKLENYLYHELLNRVLSLEP
ncbi:hypothetical protein GCM10023210_06320 [Chryseobacterium ginsengisoli]|uniref:Uncharacterized protein n=1 Tax=Chryseobacterium ginsengisoli TaxID=363853 RepID=A0ABP9LVC4_9FLAO